MRVVITHPELGVYLGHCAGFGFWSVPDGDLVPAACTFASRAEAEAHVRGWGRGVMKPTVNDPGLYGFVPLAIPGSWASPRDLRAAGLDALVGKMNETSISRMHVEGHA